jgi:hypothetical protein
MWRGDTNDRKFLGEKTSLLIEYFINFFSSRTKTIKCQIIILIIKFYCNVVSLIVHNDLGHFMPPMVIIITIIY